jgi:heme/copper-type cytochrome/quinol oxidase subunit 2
MSSAIDTRAFLKLAGIGGVVFASDIGFRDPGGVWFPLRCDIFCGTGHEGMAGTIPGVD